MTIFYYPTLLGFVPSTLAYILNPDLADNGVHTGIVIVVVFWLGMFMSARGGTGRDREAGLVDLQKLVPIVAIALVCAIATRGLSAAVLPAAERTRWR